MGKNPKKFWAPSPDSTPGSEGGHPSETTTITGYSTKSKQKKIFRANDINGSVVKVSLTFTTEPLYRRSRSHCLIKNLKNLNSDFF